jgi:hypothetical protein
LAFCFQKTHDAAVCTPAQAEMQNPGDQPIKREFLGTWAIKKAI